MTSKRRTDEPTTLHHPTAPGVTVTVDDVEPWKAQGWLMSESKAVREAAKATDAAPAE